MIARVSSRELTTLANDLGFTIQHDCGGYRVVDGGAYLFPDGGVCPTASRKECWIWLKGYKEGLRR